MHGDLKAAMGALNFYSMEEGTLAAGEIAAYERAIGRVDSYFSRLLAELFPETAEAYGLSLWERALGISSGGGMPRERRGKIIEKESREPGGFIGYLFLRQLAEICPSAGVAQNGAAVLLTGTDRGDFESLRRLAELVLPNLSPQADVALDGTGNSWNTWGARGSNWNFYDRNALPWGFYDTI